MRSLPLLCLVLGALSCSLTVSKSEPCGSNAECVTGFGWGSTCGEDGFCAEPNIPARCERSVPEDLFSGSPKYSDHIVIGALFDPEAHIDSLVATQLAIQEANVEGGLDDRDFALAICDYGPGEDELDSDEASAFGAVWLADTLGVSAIVGPRGSSRAVAAFEALGDRDVVLISPSATSPVLTTIDETNPTDENPGLLWRTVAPDGAQSKEIVADMLARDVSSLAIIFQEGAYGDALADLVETEFLDRAMMEGDDQAKVTRLPYSNSLFAAVADAAATDATEVLIVSSDIGDYVEFLQAAVSSDNQEMFYGNVGIFLPDAAFNQQLLEKDDGIDALFARIRGTRPAPVEGPLFDTFAGALLSEFGFDAEESGFTVHTYDAAWLILYAHAWALSNEDDLGGRSLARGLRRVSSGDTISIRLSDWPLVRERFANGQSIDVSGGSGALDYDPATEETEGIIATWVIQEDGSGGYEFGP